MSELKQRCLGGVGRRCTTSSGGGVSAVCPPVAEFLAAVALGEVTRCFVHLYSQGNVTEACQFEYIMLNSHVYAE
jgi:hypothetical protein